MKKRFCLIAFSIIFLCSLSLSTVLVSAYKEGYTNTDYSALVIPVEDGKYTNSTEWDDAALPPSLPTGLHWKEKWTWPESVIVQHFIIEALTDTTNDTGDYFQLCYDRDANGGTAPQSDDIKIEYVGHSQSGLKVYVGNGTAWTEFTGYTYGTHLFIAESFSSSALNNNPHWIIELRFDKSSFIDISGSGYQPWIRVAVYDASNSAAGVRDWPPASADVPNNWGLEVGTTENIPESLTVIAIVVLSTFAVISSFHFLRRRPKSTKLHFGKLSA